MDFTFLRIENSPTLGGSFDYEIFYFLKMLTGAGEGDADGTFNDYLFGLRFIALGFPVELILLIFSSSNFEDSLKLLTSFSCLYD